MAKTLTSTLVHFEILNSYHSTILNLGAINRTRDLHGYFQNFRGKDSLWRKFKNAFIYSN